MRTRADTGTGRQAGTHTRTQSHSHASMHDEGSASARTRMRAHAHHHARTPTHVRAHGRSSRPCGRTQKRSEMRADGLVAVARQRLRAVHAQLVRGRLAASLRPTTVLLSVLTPGVRAPLACCACVHESPHTLRSARLGTAHCTLTLYVVCFHIAEWPVSARLGMPAHSTRGLPRRPHRTSSHTPWR
jgi:hypothetical protein